VTDSTIRLPPGELERLAECILEPIRVPGAVQPHGLLVVVRADTLRITHVSDNAAQVIGADSIALFGRTLPELLGDSATAAVLEVVAPASVTANPVPVLIGDQSFDAIAHRLVDSIVVELEPLDEAYEQQTAALRGGFRRLSRATTQQELWMLTAQEFSRITEFDRVMVYRFHADEHGEVVAEEAAPGMEPYLGLHYPASDIPAQARALYLTKLSRMIASSIPVSAEILADTNAGDPTGLDLGGAELRAVSPHHLEFMRNMGQASTISFSIVVNGRLAGMITCAHRTPKRLPYRTRESLELLANQVSLQQAAMVEIDRLERRQAQSDIRVGLLGQVALSTDLPRALLEGPVTLVDLIPADAAVVSFDGQIHRVGTAPSDAAITEFLDYVTRTTGSLSFQSDALPLDHPLAGDILTTVAGALIRPFGRHGEYVAWFRGELTRTVNWLGDMSPNNRQSTLSPRNSFSSWTEEVGGTSAGWEAGTLAAEELCRDLDSILLRRAESALAELALRDVLTGLPNRRVVMDRLGQVAGRTEAADQLALLFIDLDGFKAINDTHGHRAGDDALQFVAQRLSEVARQDDLVARLGGDEFVMVCEGTTIEQAVAIAHRVLAAFATANATVPWTIGASIGIAMATLDTDASHLLSAADAAMYRAKLAGRNRVAF
jgi:two-component system, chemotaxis family, sensor kinase Cph1